MFAFFSSKKFGETGLTMLSLVSVQALFRRFKRAHVMAEMRTKHATMTSTITTILVEGTDC
jgi:hypothetical protein